ncbi:MAG: uncharacterized protein PWQ82_541 [Thermosediminibacterales bacterium]|nr:uncharacterized protein [Thermosediminibacterales bacterium]MDK2835955.1 uncharacterized protein [Thermosediminibacterales bacterium]
MEDIIQEMLNKKVWAVMGASTNPEKYGYKIYKKLKDKGYTVYPINPRADKIDGDKCYKGLDELPEVPEVVNLVIPPKHTEKAVEKCIELGIKYLWMQPGAESENAIKSAEQAGLKVVHNACVYMLAV